MRTFAIGDIHGCADKLEDLLTKIAPTPDDRFVFLGDYIDRGPSPQAVIERLLDLAEGHPCVFLRGNHEEMLLAYLERGTGLEKYLLNGGRVTLEGYVGKRTFSRAQVSRALPPSHRAFFEGLRWYHEDERYLYVHAGFKPGVPLDQQVPADLVWIREEFIQQPTGFTKKVIYAHTPVKLPHTQPDKINIDTGAVYGGCLTAIELPAERFIQSFR